MRKTFVSLMLSFLVLTMGTNLSAENYNIDVSAKSAVLMEMETGKVIFEKNSFEKRPMASTTKIMTVLLTLESGNLDEPFVVNSEAIKAEGSSMGLQECDIVTKRALCYGMMLPSGNDAANSAAYKLAGGFEDFAKLMNERAKEIGMFCTYFVTPSGLDAKGHGSSAYDMALLAREALKNPDFREICSTKKAKLSYGNPPYDRWLNNTNKLLDMYDGCIGVKTGFTDDAGRCLVSAAEKDGVTLIAVTLNDPSDWDDHKKILDYGFSQLKLIKFPMPDGMNSVALVGGNSDRAGAIFDKNYYVPVLEEDLSCLSYKLICESFIYAPVLKGTEIGRIELFFDDKKIKEIPVTVSENYEEKFIEKYGFFDKIMQFFKDLKSSK